jgi:hypothetical protein
MGRFQLTNNDSALVVSVPPLQTSLTTVSFQMDITEWDTALQRTVCLPIMTHCRNRHPKAFLLSHGLLLADK